MKYLTKVIETYRFDTDEQAQLFLEEQKRDPHFDVKKSSCENKEVKVKGEVADEYVKLTIEKVFNDEKYPDQEVNVIYETGAENGGIFSI